MADRPDRLKPISLFPLSPEEAIRAAMSTPRPVKLRKSGRMSLRTAKLKGTNLDAGNTQAVTLATADLAGANLEA